MHTKSIFKNKNGDSRIADILIYFIFGLLTIICVFPFYYLFINSVSDNTLVSQGKILLLPKGFHLDNYVKVFQMRGLGQAAFISLARTVLGTFCSLLGSAFLGYAVSRREMWHRKLCYRFVVVTMYFNAGIIPWYLTMKNLHLLNNFLAYILPFLVVPFYVVLFKTYVESLPASLEESAEIDGAGYMIRFSKIILPLSKPILATIAVFAAVSQWNSFTDTLFLMTNSKLFTLQFLLYQYLSEVDAIAKSLRNNTANAGAMNLAKMLTPTSIRMTISIVVVLPVLFVYPFFQRFFVKGIMIGAVKG